MEDVALKAAVVTPSAASHAPVYQDTPEMDLPALVSQYEHMKWEKIGMPVSDLLVPWVSHFGSIHYSWNGNESGNQWNL